MLHDKSQRLLLLTWHTNVNDVVLNQICNAVNMNPIVKRGIIRNNKNVRFFLPSITMMSLKISRAQIRKPKNLWD